MDLRVVFEREEIVFHGVAIGAFPIIGQILERRAGRNAMRRIAHRGVINIIAIAAHILLHNGLLFLFHMSGNTGSVIRDGSSAA